MENLPSAEINEESSRVEPIIQQGRARKWIRLAIPLIIFVLSFVFGFFYFINFDAITRYYILKQGLPLEIDRVAMSLGGRFEMERLKYDAEIKNGVEEQIRVEYVGGKVSIPGLVFSNKIKLDLNLTGVKIPLSSGQVSGGSWKLKGIVENISKNIQQWTGDVELTAENAIVQITAMNSNYIATVKSGLIRGKIKNGLLQLDTTDINADLAKITVSGSSGITNPYNLNLDFKILPLEEFGVKYPNEKSMLAAILQKETEIIVSVTGPINSARPHVKNVNIPGF